MFDISRPPLLVLPVENKYAELFGSENGYSINPLTDNLSAAAHKEGWILPLSVQQRTAVNRNPLLMIKNSGGVTANTSTSAKGYAHVFCDDNGNEPAPAYEKAVFAPANGSLWLFIDGNVTMIWFQYGEKTQFLGDTGHDSERFFYGKLLIRRFSVIEAVAPGFDKKADVLAASAKLMMVATEQLYSGGWNISNDSPEKCLEDIIVSNKLTQFMPMVKKALDIARGQ